MKHRLVYHLQLILFGLLMLTTVEAQDTNGTSNCREDAPKIMSSCTKDFESHKEKPCYYKQMLYLCNAAHLCSKNCTEAEVNELTAVMRQEINEFFAGNCSNTEAVVDLDTINCERIMDLYFGTTGDNIALIVGSIVFLILIGIIGVLVYFFACKGKGKAKSKSNSSKRKTGGKRGKSSTGRGKSSTGQGKSSTGAGKSSTGQGKSSTGASGKSTTGADSSNTAPPDGGKSAPAEAK